MMRLKINEALARQEAKGNKIFKKQISAELWPESSASSRSTSMGRLCRGGVSKISPEQIVIICKMCQCSADYLLGLTDE